MHQLCICLKGTPVTMTPHVQCWMPWRRHEVGQATFFLHRLGTTGQCKLCRQAFPCLLDVSLRYTHFKFAGLTLGLLSLDLVGLRVSAGACIPQACYPVIRCCFCTSRSNMCPRDCCAPHPAPSRKFGTSFQKTKPSESQMMHNSILPPMYYLNCCEKYNHGNLR